MRGTFVGEADAETRSGGTYVRIRTDDPYARRAAWDDEEPDDFATVAVDAGHLVEGAARIAVVASYLLDAVHLMREDSVDDLGLDHLEYNR